MSNVKTIVSEKIIEQLGSFDGLWKKPWFSSNLMNPITGTHYSGCNIFILGMLGKSGLFASYKQIQKHGGQVNKGVKALPVVFYSPIPSGKKDKNGDETYFPMMKYYSVFDLSDCSGVDDLMKPQEKVILPISDAQTLIENTGAIIKESKDRCFYRPVEDFIGMVPRNMFESTESYYSTMFHELTHWTGHSTRLDRFESNHVAFASTEYSLEELTAELGACMFSQRFGILDNNAEQSKAYLKSWWLKVKKNPDELLTALSKAWKAYQFITKKEEV